MNVNEELHWSITCTNSVGKCDNKKSEDTFSLQIFQAWHKTASFWLVGRSLHIKTLMAGELMSS
jgi:hypothetical protein